ncbi:hypothetical protein HYPDE_33953 [Hyphomicrobium denitrificans 1NES1]|uniref:Uncharacterized protein n=1 Tax=Hyphomicrobium denitrificans 1NES1 TaxID=670307 RepID=N0B626_9HYPH|nr:hypothetical protein HYPDE_33953 [Hyphomicrobium denitrificans 1NES1]
MLTVNVAKLRLVPWSSRLLLPFELMSLQIHTSPNERRARTAMGRENSGVLCSQISGFAPK